MARWDDLRVEVYGPFHRLYRDAGDVILGNSLRSGTFGGTGQFNSPMPAVKAYSGPLPENQSGFEFFTPAVPERPQGHKVYWRPRADRSVWIESGEAKILIMVSRVSQEIA